MRKKKNLKGKVKMNIIHFRALTRRYFDLILSDKLSFFTTLLQAPVMLFVIFLSCKPDFSGGGGFNGHISIFIITAIAAVMGTLNSYREICKERDVFAREYQGGLDPTAYVMSKFTVQAAMCAYHSLVLVTGSLFIINFPMEKAASVIPLFFITIYGVMLASCCLGLLISSLLKNSESAILPILLIIMAQMVLSNTIIQLPKGFLTDIISAPILTKWGVATLGHIFEFNTNFPILIDSYAVYSQQSWVAALTIILIILLSIFLSILKLRKTLKK